MSTRPWYNPITNERYDIGTRGVELPKPDGFFDFFRNMKTYMGMMINPLTYFPTYGLWAGKGYAGGDRPVSNAGIDWSKPPCMNESITKDGANPDQCYSLLDAITKSHDWRYTFAEEAKAAGKGRRGQP